MSSSAERLNEHLENDYQVDVDEQIAIHEPVASGLVGSGLSTVQRFIVDDERKATWAIRKLARIRRTKVINAKLAAAERQKIDDWLAAENERMAREEGFFVDLLTDFHVTRLVEDPKAKTIKLPGGALKSRQGADQWTFEEDTFIEWASQQERFIRTKVEIDKVAAKKSLMVREGKVLDPDTGELIPGVDVIPGERKFSVEIDG